jgi:hypothetical protein
MIGKNEFHNTHLGQFINVSGCAQGAVRIDFNFDFTAGPLFHVVGKVPGPDGHEVAFDLFRSQFGLDRRAGITGRHGGAQEGKYQKGS